MEFFTRLSQAVRRRTLGGVYLLPVRLDETEESCADNGGARPASQTNLAT